MASIAAKVYRDRLMRDAEGQFPGYDFWKQRLWDSEAS